MKNIIFLIIITFAILANTNAQSNKDSLGNLIRAQYKGGRLPPNVADPGDKEIKTGNGKIQFGSDVTGHNKKPETGYINSSKKSLIDPRMKEYDKKRASLSKKTYSSHISHSKLNTNSAKKTVDKSVQVRKSKSEIMRERILKNIDKKKNN